MDPLRDRLHVRRNLQEDKKHPGAVTLFSQMEFMAGMRSGEEERVWQDLEYFSRELRRILWEERFSRKIRQYLPETDPEGT